MPLPTLCKCLKKPARDARRRQAPKTRRSRQLYTYIATELVHNHTAGTRDAIEGKGPQRGFRHLEEVAKAVGGGYCWLYHSMLAVAVRKRMAGLWAGGPGGELSLLQCIPGRHTVTATCPGRHLCCTQQHVRQHPCIALHACPHAHDDNTTHVMIPQTAPSHMRDRKTTLSPSLHTDVTSLTRPPV